MQKLQVGSGFMIAYLVLSSTAFLVNFWLNLREVLRLARSSKEPKDTIRLDKLSTSEIGPMNVDNFLQAGPSVTENTTRELEAIPKDKIRL